MLWLLLLLPLLLLLLLRPARLRAQVTYLQRHGCYQGGVVDVAA
jgi:hypothetical protein